MIRFEKYHSFLLRARLTTPPAQCKPILPVPRRLCPTGLRVFQFMFRHDQFTQFRQTVGQGVFATEGKAATETTIQQ